MTWQIFLAFSIISETASNLLKRFIAKENDEPILYAMSYQILTGFIIFLYAYFSGTLNFSGLSHFIPNIIFATFIYTATNIIIFKSLHNVEASVFTILFQSRTIWVILISMIFLDEKFSIYNLIGTLLILAGIILVTELKGKFEINKSFVLVLVAALGYGIASPNDAYVVQTIDPSSYLAISFMLPGIATLLCFPSTIKKIPILYKPKKLFPVVFLAMFFAATAIFYFSAYKLGNNLAIISPISQTTAILTVIFAAIFLKEKDYLTKKIFAVILSFIGVLLLV